MLSRKGGSTKTRELWLLCSDDNTPFFHKFAAHRKNINTIWKIHDDSGKLVEGAKAIAEAGIQHFESLFREEVDLHLPEIVQSAGYFPASVTEEDNSELMKPVLLQDLKHILSISKNDKSLGPDGIPVEVYIALFDVLGVDLLRVIELSRTSGKIPVVFNSTFLALIPKIDHPLTFEDFLPISLCNFAYKIIGKIISIRIRNVLGRCISGEQFGFFPGR